MSVTHSVCITEKAAELDGEMTMKFARSEIDRVIAEKFGDGYELESEHDERDSEAYKYGERDSPPGMFRLTRIYRKIGGPV